MADPTREQLMQALRRADAAGDTAAAKAIAKRISQRSTTSTGKARGLGLGDSTLFGFLDEAGAVLDTLGLPAGEDRPTIWNGHGFGDAWSKNQQRNKQILNKAQKDQPGAYMQGQVVGAFIPGGLAGKAIKAAKGTGTGLKIGNVVARAAAAAPRTTRAASVIIPAAAQGALYEAGSADGGVGERLAAAPRGAALGAAGGAAGLAAGKTLGTLIGGKKVSDNVRLLADEGVVLTPGQRAGQGSLRNVFEDKVLGSIPYVGEVPAAARERGMNDLRVAVANRVLSPIGGNVPRGTPINNEAMGAIQDQVYTRLGDTAEALTLQADDDLAQGLDRVVRSSPRLAGPEGTKQVAANAAYLRDRLAEGALTGPQLRETLGEIRSAASSAQGETAKQLWSLHDEVVDSLTRQNSGELVSGFGNARESATLLKRMEDAASKSVGGEFGPTQLLQAAKRRGYGTTTGNIASGDARLYDIANAAADVMRNTTANSGTVPRAVGAGILGTGAAGATMIDPSLGALTIGSLAGYVPGVDRALQNFALNRPEILRLAGRTIGDLAPHLGLAGAIAAVQQGQ